MEPDRPPVRLYGRDTEVRLVGEFLDRPLTDGAPRSRPVPVLTFVGDSGVGKTVLLTEIARQINNQAPVARINCGTTKLRTTREILAALAFELNRQSGRYGTLPFPRLIVGQVVIAERLNALDRQQARGQVRRALEKHRRIDVLRGFLSRVAPDMLSLVGVPGAQVSRYLPDMLLRGVTAGRWGSRVVLGAGQDWYGHQDLGGRADPLDSLVDLNLDANSDDEALRRQADELLWAAFLADLRHAFSTGRRHREWSWNCAVLLDDVDAPVGLDLLAGLVKASRLRHAHPQRELDPLTVVATSRAPLSPGGGEPIAAESASHADYRQHSGSHQAERWWYPVALRDLHADEVLAMVKALELRGVADEVVATGVYRFTDGHPGTTRILLDAISDRRTDPKDLGALLRGPAPSVVGQPSATTGEVLLDSFLHGVSSTVRADLVTCSAARNLDDAARIQPDSGLLASPPGRRPEVFSTRWWSHSDSGTPQLRPVLRRLLLMRLAARPDRDAATWGETHALLRRDRREAGDEVGERYHALALGEVEWVTTWLAGLLPKTDVAAWLGFLTDVTDAPSRPDDGTDPVDQVSELTRWVSVDEVPSEPLARLVAATWLIGHPLLTTGRMGLHLELASAYDAIAPFSLDGRSRLHLEAEKHRRAAAGLPY